MSSDRGVISYPIPAFSNVPIHAEFYQPHEFTITALSLGPTTTVTTLIDNDFVIGQNVRFVMPPDSGTRELNGMTGYIITINSTTQFVVNISSVGMNAFTTPTSIQKAQILPVGDINMGQTNTGRTNNLTYIPGSFINIS